ncbi:MAG TPA: type II toxin-antitoxin system VapB family antitoxin [Thermoanaerobaculia bacterium]|nr:type II toxin-antitoxin system VapB family antitoxin [Thermoanaerobaculia bacterium]
MTAKVLRSGTSQAVRLPEEFRFPAGVEEVAVRRQGDRLILEPIRKEDWPDGFWKAFEGVSPDFERPRQVSQQRESLD